MISLFRFSKQGHSYLTVKTRIWFYITKIIMVILVFPISWVLTIMGYLGTYLDIYFLQLLVFNISQKQLKKISTNSFALTEKKIFRVMIREVFFFSIIGTLIVIIPISLNNQYFQGGLNGPEIILSIFLLVIQVLRVFGIFLATGMVSIAMGLTRASLYLDLGKQEFKGDKHIAYRIAGLIQLIIILIIPQIFNFIIEFPISVNNPVLNANFLGRTILLFLEIVIYSLFFYVYENGFQNNAVFPIMNPSFIRQIQYLVSGGSSESNDKKEASVVITTRKFISDFLTYYPEFLFIVLFFLLYFLIILYFIFGAFSQIFHKPRLDNLTGLEVTSIIVFITVLGHFIVVAFMVLGAYTEKFFIYYKTKGYRIKSRYSQFVLPAFFIFVIAGLIVFYTPSLENTSYFVIMTADMLSLLSMMFAAFILGQNLNTFDTVNKKVKNTFLPGIVVVGLIISSFYNMVDFLILVPEDIASPNYIINTHEVLRILFHRAIVIAFSVIIVVLGHRKLKRVEQLISQNRASVELPFSFIILPPIPLSDILLTESNRIQDNNLIIIIEGKNVIDKMDYVFLFLFGKEYERLKTEYRSFPSGILKIIFKYYPITALGLSRLIQKTNKTMGKVRQGLNNNSYDLLVKKAQEKDKKTFRPVLLTLPPFFNKSLTYYANKILTCDEGRQENKPISNEQKMIRNGLALTSKLPREFVWFLPFHFDELYLFIQLLEECRPRRLVIGFPPLPKEAMKEIEFLRELTLRIINAREKQGLQTLVLRPVSDWLSNP